MSHAINYNPETQTIEIIIQGTFNLDEFKEIGLQAVQLAKENECFHILSDYRKAEFIQLSTIEIYDLPKLLSGLAAPAGINASKLKRAIVVARKDAPDAKFVETVSANQGQRVKFFLEIDEAKEWLAQK